MNLPPAVKLPFSFDAIALKSDLKQLESSNWITHYKTSDYQGNWSILALRSVHGHPSIIHASPSVEMYKDTPLLEKCTFFQQVIQYFQCPLASVRLMRLVAGAKILEHTDDMGAAENLSVRIHIPIQTNKDVFFWIDKKRIQMQAGEVWFGNFNLPHAVENKGTADRIHLVLDATYNEWLERQMKVKLPKS